MEKRLLEELSKVDIQDINKEELVDIRELTFDITIPQEERKEVVIAAVKNPYCFRVGEIGVKIEFLGKIEIFKMFSLLFTAAKSRTLIFLHF